MQVDDANAEDESVVTIPKTILVEDSSPKPPPHKNKSQGAGDNKIPSSNRVAPTPKEKKGKKVPIEKGAKETHVMRRLTLNESDNSIPDADTIYVNPLFFILLTIIYIEYSCFIFL